VKDSFSFSVSLSSSRAPKSVPYSALNFSFWRSMKCTFICQSSDSRWLLTAEARVYSQGFVVDKVDRYFSEYFGLPQLACVTLSVYVLSKMVASRTGIQIGVVSVASVPDLGTSRGSGSRPLKRA
jgi:hypothetical protein